MPKFLMQATFSPDGVKNLIEQGGTTREQQLQALARSLEGSLEAVYFSPQRNEGFVILDLPDGQRINLAGTLMAVNAGGFVQIRAQPVLTARKLDSAIEKARSVKVPGKQNRRGLSAGEFPLPHWPTKDKGKCPVLICY